MDAHKVCCFIGHRKIEITDRLVLSIKNIVEQLIQNEGVRTFAFGSRSEFNSLCHEIVTDLQKEFSDVERVFLSCRSETCILENEKEKWENVYSRSLKQKVHLLCFEREIEHKSKYTSGRAAYVERNQALVDMSDFCIFYFDKDYLPPKRKTTENSAYSSQPNSGTAIAYKYAQQKRKHIINVFEKDKI